MRRESGGDRPTGKAAKSPRQNGTGGVVVTTGEHEARESLAAERARRRAKADGEKVRRERVRLAGAGVEAVLSRPYATRYLVAACRYLSRRGMRQLRRWAQSDDARISIPALRLLTDAARYLETIRLAEVSMGLQARAAVPRERETIQADFPCEGFKG